jgi:hypothetical protein
VASTKFVDKAYDRTIIADDVQLIELTSEKFRYPDGYFALVSQNESGLVAAASPVATPDPFAPKIISQAGSSMGFDRGPVASPSPSASPTGSPSPQASPSASPAGAVAAEKSDSKEPTKEELAKREESQKKLEETAKDNNLSLPAENEINKQVLKDFAAYANELKTQGKLNLNNPFEISVQAQMDENGKLKNPTVVKKAGDENLVDLFKRMISAINDSGFLTYLQPLTKDNPGATITITIKQGESDVLATVESDTSSPESARTLSKVVNTMLIFGAGSRAGKDEEVLMKNTNASFDGKKIVVKLSMPRQAVVEILQKQVQPGI